MAFRSTGGCHGTAEKIMDCVGIAENSTDEGIAEGPIKENLLLQVDSATILSGFLSAGHLRHLRCCCDTNLSQQHRRCRKDTMKGVLADFVTGAFAASTGGWESRGVSVCRHCALADHFGRCSPEI